MTTDTNTQDEPLDPSVMALELTEGLLKVIQLLVMCLNRSGALDGAEFARLLADARRELVPEGSLEESILDRVLGSLVDHPEALIRRRGFRLATNEDQDTKPVG